jgi:hypothetical protein
MSTHSYWYGFTEQLTPAARDRFNAVPTGKLPGEDAGDRVSETRMILFEDAAARLGQETIPRKAIDVSPVERVTQPTRHYPVAALLRQGRKLLMG